MPHLKDVGLIGLTHILNGGVRIQYNPSLCYVNDVNENEGSIDWRKIVSNENGKVIVEVSVSYYVQIL